ncbi:uncharacterized protein C8Q71DRAFT_501258 [Rhodofomes roseus]|uniref:Uncharacterized protein n=1 Tax=Rhodofomes roseus TaxID=34475 RepID=A0ABQ8KM89_9APHY|nr:uncharacterized protein C8Q71DRAFT_501258 [Rhodofomes roseus]KAH9839185.1 hypothetical protein C8Q71DRAFT_501258 [Rhodofomes roseus]
MLTVYRADDYKRGLPRLMWLYPLPPSSRYREYPSAPLFQAHRVITSSPSAMQVKVSVVCGLCFVVHVSWFVVRGSGFLVAAAPKGCCPLALVPRGCVWRRPCAERLREAIMVLGLHVCVSGHRPPPVSPHRACADPSYLFTYLRSCLRR